MEVNNPRCTACGAVYSRAEFQRAKETSFFEGGGEKAAIGAVVVAIIVGITAPAKWGISDWWSVLFVPLFVAIAVGAVFFISRR
jgi:hypothetical protein